MRRTFQMQARELPDRTCNAVRIRATEAGRRIHRIQQTRAITHLKRGDGGSMKSDVCFSKKTGQPLTVYFSEEDAKSSALYERTARGSDLYPYKCEKCGYWHLAPLSSKLNVQRNACSCLDSNGRHKALYLTREDAEKQRMKSEAEQHISLKIYNCSEGKGFHLTHCM